MPIGVEGRRLEVEKGRQGKEREKGINQESIFGQVPIRRRMFSVRKVEARSDGDEHYRYIGGHYNTKTWDGWQTWITLHLHVIGHVGSSLFPFPFS